jgi:hypothetical protein
MSHPKVRHPRELIEQKTNNFSNKLVVQHAQILGSVGFIYFCYILDLILAFVLAQQTYQDVSGGLTFTKIETLVSLWVVFIAQTYVQFVALPILQNYQNRQSELAEAKANVDHETFTHVATVSDSNEAKLETVMDQLNTDTQGGLNVVLLAIEELKNART